MRRERLPLRPLRERRRPARAALSLVRPEYHFPSGHCPEDGPPPVVEPDDPESPDPLLLEPDWVKDPGAAWPLYMYEELIERPSEN